MSAKSPADRALWNDQLEAAPVASREQLAVESALCRTQRDETEHRAQLRHDLVDASSTKSPADRTLLNHRLEVVPVLSREQLSVESIRNRTQRDEEEHRAQPHHNLIDAVSTKSPADRTLSHGHLAVVPVPSREKLAVESTLCRTQRDEAEHRLQLRHDLVDALSTKSPADRTPSHGHLAVVPVLSREQIAVKSIIS